jgi:hypothetical protein
VTCNPEIRKFTLEEADEFIILACDGIWDVVSSQEGVDLIAGKMKEGKELKEILSDLFDHCLSPHPSANEVLLAPLRPPSSSPFLLARRRFLVHVRVSSVWPLRMRRMRNSR